MEEKIIARSGPEVPEVVQFENIIDGAQIGDWWRVQKGPGAFSLPYYTNGWLAGGRRQEDFEEE